MQGIYGYISDGYGSQNDKMVIALRLQIFYQ